MHSGIVLRLIMVFLAGIGLPIVLFTGQFDAGSTTSESFAGNDTQQLVLQWVFGLQWMAPRAPTGLLQAREGFIPDDGAGWTQWFSGENAVADTWGMPAQHRLLSMATLATGARQANEAAAGAAKAQQMAISTASLQLALLLDAAVQISSTLLFTTTTDTTSSSNVFDAQFETVAGFVQFMGKPAESEISEVCLDAEIPFFAELDLLFAEEAAVVQHGQFMAQLMDYHGCCPVDLAARHPMNRSEVHALACVHIGTLTTHAPGCGWPVWAVARCRAWAPTRSLTSRHLLCSPPTHSSGIITAVARWIWRRGIC